LEQNINKFWDVLQTDDGDDDVEEEGEEEGDHT